METHSCNIMRLDHQARHRLMIKDQSHEKVTYLKIYTQKCVRVWLIHETTVNEEMLSNFEEWILYSLYEAQKAYFFIESWKICISFHWRRYGRLYGDNSLAGIIRITSSTPTKHDHWRNRISFPTVMMKQWICSKHSRSLFKTHLMPHLQW